MSKIYGKKECFTLVRKDASRTIISYGYKEEKDNINATWHEVYFYRKKNGKVTLKMVKEAIYEDINKQTDKKILSGFSWTPENGSAINVWLSDENQRNFSEAERIAESMPQAILPVTFKLGENKDGEPVYYQFTTSAELTGFYLQAVSYINQCLGEGWLRKDNIDWQPYQEALEEIFDKESIPFGGGAQ